MQVRRIDEQARTLEGVVAPYDETTLLVSTPGGERIKRRAFERSITQRATKIPLCVNHNHENIVGVSRAWTDTNEGLIGLFEFRDDGYADRAIADVQRGYLEKMSVGFVPIDRKRADDGVMEIREGLLCECSLVILGAYDGADVLAARIAQQTEELFAPFQNPPDLPIPFAAPWV
jgi:hypothetical protein